MFLPMYSFQLCRLRLPCVPDMPHPAVPGPPCPGCSWPMAVYAPCCSGQTCGRMLWACHASQMMRSRPPQVRCAASPGAAGWHGSGALQSQQVAAMQLAAMAADQRACCRGGSRAASPIRRCLDADPRCTACVPSAVCSLSADAALRGQNRVWLHKLDLSGETPQPACLCLRSTAMQFAQATPGHCLPFVGLAEWRQQPRCDLLKGRSFLGCVMSAERGLQYVFDRDMFAHSIQRHCK